MKKHIAHMAHPVDSLMCFSSSLPASTYSSEAGEGVVSRGFSDAAEVSAHMYFFSPLPTLLQSHGSQPFPWSSLLRRVECIT